MGVTNPSHAFTTSSGGGLLTQLTNNVAILNSNTSASISAVALWDTGASLTCISTDVVTALGLIPIGKQEIHTPSGSSIVNKYLISVILPGDVAIQDIEVCDSKIGEQNIEILIGMDIITMGDFSVSNYKGNTVFTFRIPSSGVTDYVAQLRIKNITGVHGGSKKK